MQMSTCFGRGVRLQQAPASSPQQVPPTPPAASPAVAVGPSRLSHHHHHHHHPACLVAKGEAHQRTSIVAAASASANDEPSAVRKYGSNSTQRRESRASDGDRRGGRGGRGRGSGGHRRANNGDVDFGKWEEGRRERRADGDGGGRGRGRGGGERSRGPYRPRESNAPPSYDRVSPRATLNRHLKDVESCQQLAQLLRNQPPEALTAVNVATAWVRLGSLQSRSNGARGRGPTSAADGGGGGGGGDAAGDVGEGTASPGTAVVRQLLDPTAAVAVEMDLRQIANTFWGMAKVGDGILKSCRPSRDGDRAQQSNSGDSNSNSSSSSPEQAIRLLQQRAVELLQLLAPSQQQQQPGGGGGGGGGAQRLDIRDATQLWYGMAGLPYSWSDDLEEALEEATIQAMEAAVLTAAEGAADAAASCRDRDGGSRNGGGSGGHSSGWVESPTAVAQIVFRMAAVCGGRMGASHKARLAAVVDAMSYNGGDDDDDVAAASLPLDNPDCLLVGAQLLRLDLPPAAVRRLHDMALTLPPAVAARTGRTAMARALRSAVGLGLQPSAGEARRWESRLLGELGGQTWTGEELSWTMLALSYVKSYLPDAEAREELLGALRRLVRQLRANDATRVQQAMDVWGLRLPEREAALLRQKASGAGWSEPREERGGGGGGRGGGGGGGGGGRGGGGGGGGSAFRSWGFAR